MFSWLSLVPVVGKLFDSTTAYFNKKQDVALEKYKVDGTVDIEMMKTDLSLIQAQKELRLAEKDAPGVRVSMSLILVSTAVWFTLYMWDSSFRGIIPDWTWRVLTPEAEVWKIMMVAVGYLFLNTVKQVWRR